MNTLVRTINQADLRLSRLAALMQIRHVNFTMMVLIGMLLFSALGLVYLKDLNRRLFIQSQQAIGTEQNTQVVYSKLLLEESTWASQARIQELATKDLAMIIPAPKDIVMVEGQRI